MDPSSITRGGFGVVTDSVVSISYVVSLSVAVVGAAVVEVGSDGSVVIARVVVTASVVFGRSITQGTMIAIRRTTPSPIPPPIFN